MSDTEVDAFEQQKLREREQEVGELLRMPDAQEFEDQRGAALVMAEPSRKPAAKAKGSRKQRPSFRERRSADEAGCPPLAAFVGRPWTDWVATDLPVKEPPNSLSAKYVEPLRETLKRKTDVELRAEEKAVLDSLRAAKEAAAAVLKKRRSGRSNWGGLNNQRGG
jgi:hypothetical protein